jgi:hemoglobin
VTGVIVDYIRSTIAADRRDAFEGAYERGVAALAPSPHCLAYALAHCAEAPEHSILRIAWDSLAGHLQGFRARPAFGACFAAVRPFVDDIGEMRHYAVTPIAARKDAASPDEPASRG